MELSAENLHQYAPPNLGCQCREVKTVQVCRLGAKRAWLVDPDRPNRVTVDQWCTKLISTGQRLKLVLRNCLTWDSLSSLFLSVDLCGTGISHSGTGHDRSE